MVYLECGDDEFVGVVGGDGLDDDLSHVLKWRRNVEPHCAVGCAEHKS